MWNLKHVVGTGVTVILVLLSLADAPEQLAKWKLGWDRLVANAGVDWVAFWSGPSGRLTLVLAAIAVGLWSWEVPQKLWLRYVVSPRQAVKRPSTETALKVLATKMGYYDNVRRREGDVFTIKSEQAFSSKWMERVLPDTPEKMTTSAQALRQVEAGLRGRNPEEADVMRVQDLEQALAWIPTPRVRPNKTTG